jgi:hypothetical protein
VSGRGGGAGAREVHDAVGFYRRGRNRAFTARGHPSLNSRYGKQPRPARAGETRGDRWTTPCADGGEGRDSTWRGRGLQGPRSAPNLGKKRPRDGARGPGRRGGRGAHAGALGAQRRGAARRRPARPCDTAPLFERLNSKNLNRSAPSGE